MNNLAADDLTAGSKLIIPVAPEKKVAANTFSKHPTHYKVRKGDTVLSVADDSYYVASKVHDLTVKIRPDDTQKIALIRDLIARHVDANKILAAL